MDSMTVSTGAPVRPVYEGAEAVLKQLKDRKFRKKRLKGVRIVGRRGI